MNKRRFSVPGEKPKDDPDAPIWGAENMAPVIGRTERQVFHMLNAGLLPAKKVGGRWVSTRRKLLAAILGEAA